MNTLIEIKNLTLGYGSNTVIKSANITIKEKDFICVVGANGSGKSTLIKSILGLLKPQAGQITFAENTLAQQHIGYLPQENKTDYSFPATVNEIVLSGTLGQLGLKPFYGKTEKACAKKNLKLLGIDNLKNHSFADLSGGQKQKVLLARALAASSKLLILDEPSNNLDHSSRKDFYQTLKDLNRQGITIIMITHDLDADDLIGNKVVSLKNGQVETATTQEFLKGFHK